MSTINGILTKLGLTENEQNIYTAYLSNPNTTAAEIARKLKMDKSSAYRAVEDLEKKRLLISSPKKKGTTFTAASPEILKEIYENQKIEMNAAGEQLDRFINDLKKSYGEKRNTFITIEEGLDAQINRMGESLNSKELVIREFFRRHDFFNDKKYREYVKQYANERVKRGIKMIQMEYDMPDMASDFYEIMNYHKKFNKEVRLLPRELNDTNSLRIWDDTINIISYGETKEFLVITIKDRFVANLMKNMFDYIWKNAKIYPSKD